MKIKRLLPLLLFLVFLAMISGFLMSKASLIGRIGIGLFYHEYRFLKTWWKGALAVFAVLFILLVLLAILQHKMKRSALRLISLAMILLALIGFYFTWQDFHQTRTHRMLGDRFHLGAYLFWLGFAVTAGYFLFTKQQFPTYEKERWNPDVPQERPLS